MRASVPCRLLAGGHPQFLALWAIPSWQLVVASEARETLDACSQGLYDLLGEVRSGSRKQSATMYITEYNKMLKCIIGMKDSQTFGGEG